MKRLLAGLLAFLLAAQPAAAAGQKQAPVPAMPVAVVPAAGVSPASLPNGTISPQTRIETMATPLPPSATVDGAKAAQNGQWEASGTQPKAADAPIATEASKEARRPELAPADQARLDAAVANFGPVPTPPVVRGKLVAMGTWLGTAAAGAALHIPSDRIAPLIIGLIFAPLISLMWGVFAGAMNTATAAPAGRPTAEADQTRWDYWREKAKLAASAAKLPEPKTLTVHSGDTVQAQAGGSPSDYQFIVYGGMDQFPEKQQEAVLHHEAGHIKHYDTPLTMAQMFLVTVGPTVAMMAGVQNDALSLAAIPLILLSVPLWFKAKKRDEYNADQHASHAMGSPEQMVRFFAANAEDDEREAVLRAAEGRPADKPVGWKAKTLAAWRAFRLMLSSHPSHAQRVARLRRLAVSDPAPR